MGTTPDHSGTAGVHLPRLCLPHPNLPTFHTNYSCWVLGLMKLQTTGSVAGEDVSGWT